MALVCDICAKEVEIIIFGRGFVGICCNKVFYNDECRPQFDVECSEEKDTDMHLFLRKEGSYQEKHP